MYWTDGPMIERKLLAVRERARKPFWRRFFPRWRDREDIAELLYLLEVVEREKARHFTDLSRQASILLSRWTLLQGEINASIWSKHR